MKTPERYRLTLLEDSEWLAQVHRLESWVFLSEVSFEDLSGIELPLPWGRIWGAEANNPTVPTTEAAHESVRELAAMYCTYTLRAFPVPGAEVACGWLSWVGVHPGHRRRGLLRKMVAHHFDDCLKNGEAISVLNATDAAIYGRFGYGMAAPQVIATIPRGATLHPVPGSAALDADLHVWDPSRQGNDIAAVHREYARVPEGIGRPGWVSWETPELRRSADQDPPALRGGREALRVLLVRDADRRLRGYARFRRKPGWSRVNNTADGTVELRDSVALDAPAAHLLWSVLLDLDLMTCVEAGPLLVDDPIFSLLVDSRAVTRVVSDLQWLRILDLPRALSERHFAAPIDVVIDVTDDLIAANRGRWHIHAEAFGAAEVARTDAEPDLSFDIRALGAAHLGTVSLASLALAGLVQSHSPQALARAATAWSWPTAAGANWML